MRCTRTRGKKGVPHRDPEDPPRKRANRFKGHGTWDNDRPPVLGIVSRDEGKPLSLQVVSTASRAVLEPPVLSASAPGSTLYSDECMAYNHLNERDRQHATVNHNAKPKEFARDDDGDGVREVHCNTLEGIWTGLRNFLRIFRGVSKIYLQSYVTLFEWGHRSKRVTAQFVQALLGIPTSTAEGT